MDDPSNRVNHLLTFLAPTTYFFHAHAQLLMNKAWEDVGRVIGHA